MSGRTSIRDVVVGLLVIAALVGFLGLMHVASDGPGFLAPQKTIDVVFRDGQGIRVGSPVRVAGLDAGQRRRPRPGRGRGDACGRGSGSRCPTSLVKKLRQDVKITIKPGLTGHEPREHRLVGQVGRRAGARAVDPGGRVLVLRPDPRAGRARPGRAEPPEPHDRRGPADGRPVGPRVRQMLRHVPGDDRATCKDMSDAIRPAVESTVGHVEDLSRRISASTPKIEATLARLEIDHAAGGRADARREPRRTPGQPRHRPRPDGHAQRRRRPRTGSRSRGCSTGSTCTRARGDRVLYQADSSPARGCRSSPGTGPRSSGR